ncbi:hypothetical protein HYT56_00380 [Candidatus Woesearchaeota archaeon]|nr:hypothetical protein [Candidatus Woesearchaeota archaeon]
MNNLYGTVGILSLSLLFGCGNKETESKQVIEYMNLQGTVFSERYMSAPGAEFFPTISGDSRYSFSVDTEYGRKAIQVISNKQEGIYKESIDALIEPGTKVEIMSIRKQDLGKQVHIVLADRIKMQ